MVSLKTNADVADSGWVKQKKQAKVKQADATVPHEIDWGSPEYLVRQGYSAQEIADARSKSRADVAARVLGDSVSTETVDTEFD